jgi:hypothetical protein
VLVYIPPFGVFKKYLFIHDTTPSYLTNANKFYNEILNAKVS